MSGFCCFNRWGILIALVMTVLSFPAQGEFTFQSFSPTDLPSIDASETFPNRSGKTALSQISPFYPADWMRYSVQQRRFSSEVENPDAGNDFQPAWRQTEAGSSFPTIHAGALDTMEGWGSLQDEPVQKWSLMRETTSFSTQPGYFQVVATTEPGTIVVSASASMIPLSPALVSGGVTLGLMVLFKIAVRRKSRLFC